MAKVKLDENLVAQNVKEIIEKLGVSAKAEVFRQDQTFFVDINSEDSSLLIGKHGINLESLQFVLAVRLKSHTGQEDFELFVDVDGWRQKKDEKLRKMALSLAEKVTVTGQTESLYNLTAAERRIMHTALSGHPTVTTTSEGTGPERHLIISPK